MKSIQGTLKKYDGQGMVEYALIIGLVAVITVAMMVLVGPKVKNMTEKAVSPEELGKGEAGISSSVY